MTDDLKVRFIDVMGRIYYQPEGELVLVSVHVKQDDKDQRRHLTRLRSF